jgi:hypothetical protein
MPKLTTRRAATTAATACAALAIAAAAVVLPSEPSAGARTSLLASGAARGKVRISNSERGQPILTASPLDPGSVVRGSVRLANAGEVPTRVSLRMARLRDAPGIGGVPISRVLELKIFRRKVRFRAPLQSPPGRPRRLVYDGPLAQMPQVRLGRWAVGAHRRFRFRVEFPDGGVPPFPDPGDNAYEGASASARFAWGARRAP